MVMDDFKPTFSVAAGSLQQLTRKTTMGAGLA